MKLTRNASYRCIASEVRQALADHRPHWQRVHDRTFSTSYARFRLDARIPADAIEASQSARTVSVHSAFRLSIQRLQQTGLVWVTGVTRGAPARGTVTDDGALRGWRTVARVDASLVTTGQGGRTVVVAGALWSFADSIRVALVPIGAVAPWSVVSIGRTECIDSALGHRAGVYALVVDAGLGQGAFSVAATSDCKGTVFL